MTDKKRSEAEAARKEREREAARKERHRRAVIRDWARHVLRARAILTESIERRRKLIPGFEIALTDGDRLAIDTVQRLAMFAAAPESANERTRDSA